MLYDINTLTFTRHIFYLVRYNNYTLATDTSYQKELIVLHYWLVPAVPQNVTREVKLFTKIRPYGPPFPFQRKNL